jgi:hypothetical protein
MNKAKSLLAAALTLIALLAGTGVAQAGTTDAVGVQAARTLCYAQTVDVRWSPGGSPTGRLVHQWQTVNVVDYRDGVWWEINSPYSGFVLAQYFC